MFIFTEIIRNLGQLEVPLKVRAHTHKSSGSDLNPYVNFFVLEISRSCQSYR